MEFGSIESFFFSFSFLFWRVQCGVLVVLVWLVFPGLVGRKCGFEFRVGGGGVYRGMIFIKQCHH